MARSDEEPGGGLVDYDDSKEYDEMGENVNMLHDSDSTISSTIDSEDETFASPYSNWKVIKMTMSRGWLHLLTQSTFLPPREQRKSTPWTYLYPVLYWISFGSN
jgi:hypothetical protein